MNSGHGPMATWGSEYLSSATVSSIVDFGCGGGQNAKNLLSKFPTASLTAIDYSEVSVEKTKQLNSAEIEKARCDVQQGDVSNLSLNNDSFEIQKIRNG